MLDQRGQLLRAVLGLAGLPATDRTLHALRSYLDSWAGIGRIAVGMAHQGFDLQLTRYDERGWRATFYTTGMEHSPTSATGTVGETRHRKDFPLTLLAADSRVFRRKSIVKQFTPGPQRRRQGLVGLTVRPARVPLLRGAPIY